MLYNFFICIACIVHVARAGPTLPTIVANDMILQRDAGNGEVAQVWGQTTCGDGQTVTVQLSDSTGTLIDTQTPTIALGKFVATFAPQAGSLNEHNIVFTDCTGNTGISGVLFGDVYHCSGQSNMERPLTNIEFSGENTSPTVAYLSARSYARWFAMQRESSNGGFNGFNTPSRGSGWLKASDTSGSYNRNKDNGYPSRMCAGMIEELLKIWDDAPFPIGFVQTAQGGTEIEQWMSNEAETDASGAGTCGGTDMTPLGLEITGDTHTLHDAYIAPITNMKFRASVWMQGMKNSDVPDKYKCMLASMIKDWQNKFTSATDMPFYTVLVDGYGSSSHTDDTLAHFRAAQIEGSQKAHKADFVNSIDQGYYPNVHSPYKLEVGRRIAMKIMRDVYEQPQIDSNGPKYVNAVAENSNGVNYLRVNFEPTTVEDLQVSNTVDCGNNRASEGCCSTTTQIQVNGVMVPLTSISVDGTSLLIDLDSISVTLPTTLTIGYHNYLGCMVFSNFACQAGLIPADPISVSI